MERPNHSSKMSPSAFIIHSTVKVRRSSDGFSEHSCSQRSLKEVRVMKVAYAQDMYNNHIQQTSDIWPEVGPEQIGHISNKAIFQMLLIRTTQ